MVVRIIICLLVAKTTEAQVNGEFWWLNDKVTKLNGLTMPPPPKFEELSEFDTDESAKIIFRDDSLISTGNILEETQTIENGNAMKNSENDLLETENIKWPDNDTLKDPTTTGLNNDNTKLLLSLITPETTTQIMSDKKQNSGDILIFKYPEDDSVVFEYAHRAELLDASSHQNFTTTQMSRDDQIKLNETSEAVRDNKKSNTDIFTIKFPDEKLVTKYTSEPPKKAIKQQSFELADVFIDNEIINSVRNELSGSNKDNSFSENICSFLKKKECYQRNGIIHVTNNDKATRFLSADLVCCVLPLTTNSDRIVFPDSPELQRKRFRRSTKEETARQRDFLLRQKFRPQGTSIKPTIQTKVVTPDDDDYVDPYLNIKGGSLKKLHKHNSNKQDCSYQDYVEDYVVELPRPGLVGLYSDNGNRPPWSFGSDNSDRPNPPYGVVDYSEEYDEPLFGYSTIDPRKGTSKAPKRGRPLKITTAPQEEVTFNVESQTVSFQSSPNFQVLQGFKLLNLGRTKNKFYSKNNRRSTTEGVIEESGEPDEYGSHSGILDGTAIRQVFDNCGRTRKLSENDRKDKQFGEAENGSHPWMALVVLTRRAQGILCYATIVHPRAAVTAGDCVYGRTSPKEVTMLAGLWNLSNRSRVQNRVVTVQLHPQYRPNVLAHDLAMLHWKTPLKLNANIQPACLGSISDTDDCKFFGWGGFDQGIRPKSRWQRASFLPPQECGPLLAKSVKMPGDAFCATVTSRGTVTGIGGPLICTVNGRKTTTGVAVWRDNALVLIPAQEWLTRAFQDLSIE